MRKPALLLILAASSFTASAQSDANSTTVNNAIQELSSNVAGNSTTTAVGSFVSFHAPKENTKGRRFLLADWAKGSVTTAQDLVLQNDNLAINYDKLSHDLYYSLDHKTVIEAERSHIKSFHLIANDGKSMDFCRLDLIRSEVFFQQFTPFDNTHYGLYSLTTTTFKKADYRTDGMVETGNNYDEYIDNVQYYVVSPGGKEYQPVELKKKSVRASLPNAKAKVEEYLSQHKNDDINETFLKDLIEYVNKS